MYAEKLPTRGVSVAVTYFRQHEIKFRKKQKQKFMISSEINVLGYSKYQFTALNHKIEIECNFT